MRSWDRLHPVCLGQARHPSPNRGAEVVVNFARVTVQLVGVDQLPSVLPSFSTVFNVTNGTEDDVVDIVVDIDNDSSAVRTTTSTTTESDAWLCKVVQPQPVGQMISG